MDQATFTIRSNSGMIIIVHIIKENKTTTRSLAISMLCICCLLGGVARMPTKLAVP